MPHAAAQFAESVKQRKSPAQQVEDEESVVHDLGEEYGRTFSTSVEQYQCLTDNEKCGDDEIIET